MKYKELRMTCIMGALFVGFLGGSLYFFLMENSKRGILALVFSFFALMTLLTRYQMKFGEDYVVLYSFKGIGILPVFIDFKDIDDITLLSKHKIVITHEKRKTTAGYIVNAKEFYNEINEVFKEYQKVKGK